MRCDIVAHPASAAEGALIKCSCFFFFFLTILSDQLCEHLPKFTQLARMVELWLQMNELKLFFGPSIDVAVATSIVDEIDSQYSHI